ncbi:MAG: hypothetical protein ACK58T_30930 [Phycisphaerae bacterium]|jgi:hypothetical protein
MALRVRNGVSEANAKNLLNKMNSTAQLVRLGSHLQGQRGTLRATYDFAIQGGAIGTVNLRDSDNQLATLPDKAIVLQVYIDEVTNVTSGGSATIAVGLNTTTDLLGATAIASFTGIIAGVPTGTAATMVKATAARTITATIGTAAVTAGKLNVFIDYVISE